MAVADSFCFLPQNEEEKYITLKSNILKQSQSISYKKKGIFYTGIVDSKSLIHTPIEIEASIPDDSIEDYITTKTYEELGLDFNIEYVIKFTPKEAISPEYREFDVFAISKESIDKRFEYATNSVKHIDFITSSPFLFSGLYANEILSNEETHCFAYISYSDSFLTLYKNGEFLYFKSMEFSIEELFKKFSFIHPNVLKIDEFLATLEKDDEKYQEGIDKIYNDIGSYISDILLYIKRVYSVEIDQFFIDSDVTLDDIFFKYVASYLEIAPQKFEFDYKFTGEATTHLVKLSLLKSLSYSENDLNLTTFEKDKDFIHKDSGKFILTIGASVLIALAYPAYNYGFSLYTDFRTESKMEDLLKHKSLVNDYKMLFRALDNKKQQYQNRLKVAKDKNKNIKELINKIVNTKSKYSLKIDKIVKVIQDINLFDIYINKLNIRNDSELDIYVTSNSEEEITKFVKKINKKYIIRVKKIEYNSETFKYKSQVTVKRLK